MNPESSGASASSRLGLLSCWVQNSLSQLGLIATDAILCAVGHKVEIRLSLSYTLSRRTWEESNIAREQRVWMGVSWNLQGEFWWSWVCTGPKRIPGTTLLTSVHRASFSLGSSLVFSPKITLPGIWFVLLLLQLLIGLTASIIPPSSWKTHPQACL